jgi:hypothetical protein
VKGKLVLMKVMMMSENRSSWSQVHVTAILGSSGLSLNRHPCLPNEEAGQFSTYTSHVIGRGQDKDGQRRHTIGPSWDLRLSDC